MSDKFQNKYRIPSARLQNWDYGSNAMYFVTICTKNRENYFGDIVLTKMQLSEIGKIVESEWFKTPEIRPDMNLQLGVYVIMPNHFHGIIVIGENKYNIKNDINTVGGDGDGDNDNDCRDAMHGVSTDNAMDDQRWDPMDDQRRDAMHRVFTGNPTDKRNHFGPQSKNLASIMRGFKSAVTVQARKIHADFAWQPRFHDHIIRNDESFQKISKYIANNPLNWYDDKDAMHGVSTITKQP